MRSATENLGCEVLLWRGKDMNSEISIKMPRCKGCGICVAFCPKQVLGLDDLGKVQVLNPDACIGCGQCELRCPDYAIFVDRVKKEAAAK